MLEDWIDSDDSNDSDNNIDVSRLPVKPMHHHKINNIESSGATGFHYASPLAYLSFDTQSKVNYQAKGSSSSPVQMPIRNWVDSGEIASDKADTTLRPEIKKSVLDWKIIRQVRKRESYKILREKVVFICQAII